MLIFVLIMLIIFWLWGVNNILLRRISPVSFYFICVFQKIRNPIHDWNYISQLCSQRPVGTSMMSSVCSCLGAYLALGWFTCRLMMYAQRGSIPTPLLVVEFGHKF